MAEVWKVKDAARLEGIETGRQEAAAQIEFLKVQHADFQARIAGLEAALEADPRVEALEAELVDLRSMYAEHRAGLETALRVAEAERDRLRALVTRQRIALQLLSDAGGEPSLVVMAETQADELLIDPDGIAAAEWVEIERADAYASGRLDAERALTRLEAEREKAAEP